MKLNIKNNNVYYNDLLIAFIKPETKELEVLEFWSNSIENKLEKLADKLNLIIVKL
jgi:hypothetical protein